MKLKDGDRFTIGDYALKNDNAATHCVKSVRIRSFFSLHFPAFGLNTERYVVSIEHVLSTKRFEEPLFQ